MRALDAGEVVERALRRLVGERKLGVAEDLAVLDRDEDGLGPVAAAAHVALEPFVEHADLGLLLTGDVGVASRATSQSPSANSGRSAHATISIPGGGSTDGASIVVRASTIRELRPPPGSRARPPGKAAGVILGHGTFELGGAVVGRPPLELGAELVADAVPAPFRHDERQPMPRWGGVCQPVRA